MRDVQNSSARLETSADLKMKTQETSSYFREASRYGVVATLKQAGTSRLVAQLEGKHMSREYGST